MLYSTTAKFTGLTVLGSLFELVSGHRCRCTVDVKHHFKVHTEHQVCIANRSSHTLTRRALSSLSIFQLNEFSFVMKLSTMTVCRQSILTSTTLELPFYSLSQLFSDWLATLTLNGVFSSQAFFHELLIIYSHTMFHAILGASTTFINLMVPGLYLIQLTTTNNT